jgi:hypothetical protein
MENEIPFPLLSGQYISVIENETVKYYRTTKQPKMFDLTYSYEIPPSGSIADQTITLGTGNGALSVFKTGALKEWVTWIDNKYLKVDWNVLDVKLTSLTSFSEPLTKITSPYGSSNFPMFILKNSSGSVTFTLTNNSPLHTISGTLHIILYEYAIEESKAVPQVFTNIMYPSGGK